MNVSHTEPGVLGTSPSVAEILSGNNNTTCLLHFWKRPENDGPLLQQSRGWPIIHFKNTKNILNSFSFIQISQALLFFGPRQKLEKGVIRALSNENVKPVALNSMQQ